MTKKFTTTSLSIAGIAALILALGACSGDSNDTSADSGSADTNTSQPVADPDTDGASDNGAGLPDGWPQAVPVPSEGLVEAYEESGGFFATYEMTADQVDALQEVFAAQGFEQGDVMDLGDEIQTSWGNPDWWVVLNAAFDDGSNAVTLNYVVTINLN